MNSGIFYSIMEIVSVIMTIVLIFIGLRTSIKVLDKDAKDKIIPREIFIKSTKIVVAGIFFYGLARYSSNRLSADSDGYGMMDTMIQSLWEAIYTVGFVALLPYVIYRFSSPKHKEHED